MPIPSTEIPETSEITGNIENIESEANEANGENGENGANGANGEDTVTKPLRPKSKELDPTMRARLCELHSIGWGYRRIHSKHPNIAISTIRNTIKMESKRENQKSLPRTGTPKKLSPEQQRLLIDRAAANPQMRYKEMQELVGNKVSKSTIRRLLKSARQKGGIVHGTGSSSSSSTNTSSFEGNGNNDANHQTNNMVNIDQRQKNNTDMTGD